MKNRWLEERILRRARSKIGRILVLTGARQTGKTTLAQRAFDQVPYISLEDPALRPTFARLSAAEWIERFPVAVIDEVQKAPSVIETVKAAYDASSEVRYVLLGSSQVLLLSRVKESLAGRAAVEELWPLTLPEMHTASWSDPVVPSRLVEWLDERCAGADPLLAGGMPLASRSYARSAELFERYLRFGGMPLIHDPELTDEDRRLWLRDYRKTYLERDLGDLAALRDLEPFVIAQEAIAARSGRLLNWARLARIAGVAPATAKRFMRYLELSYQAVLLRPFHRNEGKRLAKAPKVHFIDPGVLRTVLNRRGAPTGEEVESAVVVEVVKQVRTAGLAVDLYHLRTHDGREVDLLLELPEGFVAIEVKAARRVAPQDARSLRGLEQIVDRPLLGRLVLSRDPDARRLDDVTLAVPIAWALGPAA